MPALLVDRDFYRSSGRANWGQFLARQIGLAALAAVGAALAFIIYRYVIHLVVIMPVLAGCMLGAVGQSVVNASRCRNRWAAAAGGVLAACIFFFGTYYVQLLWIGGWNGLTRFDLIPTVIVLSIKHTVLFHGFHAQGEPNIVLNAIIVAVEFLCVLGPAVAIPFKHASRIYCDHCDRWTESISTTVAFNAAALIVLAVENEQLRELPELPTVDADISRRDTPQCTLVTLDHCADGAETGCPIYLSLRQYPKQASRIRVRRVEIDQLEALRLMLKTPGLRGLDGSGADLEPESGPPETGEAPTASAEPMA